MKVWLRLFAIYDILFSEKWELKTWKKNGENSAITRLDKQEFRKSIK